MKRIAILVSAFVVLVVAAVAAAPLIVSTDLVKRHITEQITLWTGRAVNFRGEPVVSFYPYLTVALDGLTIANAQSAATREPFMAVDRLEAKLRLVPLLFGRIEVAEFRLVRPEINLQIDADGHPNWLMQRGAVASEVAATDAAPPPVRGRKVAQRPRLNLTLGHFVVSDGVIVYDDKSARRRDVAAGVNLDFTWPGTLQAASGSGSLLWRGEPVQFNATINSPLDLMAGGHSPLRFALVSKPVRIAFSGKAINLADLQVEGNTTLTSPSVRRAIEWLGTPMGTGPTLGSAAITGKMNWIGPSISFADATVELDGNKGDGALSVTFVHGRPTFQGTLDFDRLDLSAYLEAAQAELGANGPWPIAPVSLPMSACCDLDLRLSTDEVLLGATRMGKAASAAIKDGRLTIDIGDAQFYGGHLQAGLTAELQAGSLVATAEAKLDGLPLKAALADFAGLEGLDGMTSASVDLTAEGKSWGEFAAGVSGTAKFAIADGSIDGIEIGDMVRHMAEPDAHPFVPGREGSTSFKTLTGSLQLDEGAISTDDLQADGKDFTVEVNGMTSLFSRSLDARGTLHVADTSSGGVTAIPFLISGNWRQPMLLPDRQHSVRREPATPAQLN